MDRIRQLRLQASEKMKEHTRLLSESMLSGRDMSEVEIQDADRLRQEMEGLLQDAAKLEFQRAAEASLRQPVGERPACLSGMQRKQEPEGIRPGKSAKYADLFGSPGESLEGWKSGEEFLSTLGTGLFDERLARISMAASEGVPSAGGYAVPSPMAAKWLDEALESEIVRPRAEVWPMTADTLQIPGWDGATHSSNLFGGLASGWTAELGSIDEDTAAVRRVTMSAKKLAIITQASNELLADGVGYDVQLENALVKTLSFDLDYAFLRGDGAGKPKGVLYDPALVEVSAEGGQGSTTIVYANLCKMFARLHPACLSNSVWVASNSTIPQLLQLSVVVGTGGSHIPVITESNGTFRMLTRPVLFSEKLPPLGTKGDILLVDFSQYAVGLRKEISVDRSMHLGFQTDATYFRSILRADGFGKWKEAVTPKNGGDSLSWCVALASR